MTLRNKINLACSLFVALLCHGPLAHALESDRHKVLIYEANQLTADKQAQLTTLRGNVLLKQGSLEIHAQVARLHGPVADLQLVIIEGNPATLTQRLDTDPGRLNAQAQRIEYHLAERTIELIGEAVIDQGVRVLRGERISYDLDSGQVIGDGGDGRVRIRVQPKSQDEPPDPAP